MTGRPSSSRLLLLMLLSSVAHVLAESQESVGDGWILPDLQGWTYNQAAEDTLMRAEWRAASKVSTRLEHLYRASGVEAVRPAMPALVHRYFSLVNTPDSLTGPGEGHGEFEINLLGFLSKIGDHRSRPALLDGMTHSNLVADGLRLIGHSVLPAVLDSVNSQRDEMRRGAMRTLFNIAEADSNFFSSTEWDSVRTRLMSRLEVENDGLTRSSVLRTLHVFADTTAIPLLEHIAQTDEWVSPFRKRHTNRILAGNLAEKLKKSLPGQGLD